MRLGVRTAAWDVSSVMTPVRSLIAALIVAAVAGPVSADPAPPGPQKPAQRAVPTVALNDPRLFLARPDAEAYGLKRAGIARTAVDRRFNTAEDLTGSLGFLCGLQPGAERSGAAAARGYDPSGRFLGAKLSLAFR